jgi:L-iditol 2-dehydrogenase
VGAPSAVVQAADLVKKRGHVTVIGIFPGKVELPMTRIVRREITLAGAYDARWSNFRQSIELIKDGVINAGDLITHRFHLEDAVEAFGVAKSKVGCKVIFVP